MTGDDERGTGRVDDAAAGRRGLDDPPVIDPRDPLGLGDVEAAQHDGDAVADPDVRPADAARSEVGEVVPGDASTPDETPVREGAVRGGAPVADDVPEAEVVPVDAPPGLPVDAADAPPDDAATAGPSAEGAAAGSVLRAEPDAGTPAVSQAESGRPTADALPDDLRPTVDAVAPTDGADPRTDAPAVAVTPDAVPPADGGAEPPSSPDPPPAGAAADPPPPAGVPAAAPVDERSAWARLAHAMRPRTTTGQLLTAALCALLGFALVVQVRQTTDTQLGALRQDDLVRLLDETTSRSDELAREAADLQRERDELLSGSDRQQAALDAARRNAATQGILTGRLPATGPGVEVTLTESEPSIRAATMLHVLEELRNAGAEAIQLNDQRVTASSAFTGSAGAVVLDGVTLSPPYRWLVIGDPDTIATALEIPGGAIASVRTDGGRGTVETLDRVEVTALRRLPDPVHATPVPDEG